MRRAKTGVVAIVVAGLLSAASTTALAQTATAASGGLGGAFASSGNVSASLTYKGSFPNFSNLHLTITNSGSQLFDAPVRSTLCPSDCGPIAFARGTSPLNVLDLDNDGQPEVILGLYSGGAHCCFVFQVYSFDPGTVTYTMSEHDFADAGATIRKLSGRYAFVSANEAFAYAFTDFADSGAPRQIWRFDGGVFTDVTRQFRSRIRADAAKWWRAFNHDLSNGEGLIAAWAADEDMLGHEHQVSSTLARQLKLGHLVGGVPSGAKYVKALERLLHKLHYS